MSERVRAAQLWTSKRLNWKFRLFVDAEDARFGIRLCSTVMPNRLIACICRPAVFHSRFRRLHSWAPSRTLNS